MTSHITGLVTTSFAILRQLKSASLSHAGCDSPSSAKFDPEQNRSLQCCLCRLATTQHHSAPGGRQRCCSLNLEFLLFPCICCSFQHPLYFSKASKQLQRTEFFRIVVKLVESH